MKTRPAALSLVMVFLIATTATEGASGLPTAPPEQVGLSTERLGRLARVLNAEIEAGKIPGAVALVARKGKVAYFESFGLRDKAAGVPMTKDAIFRIYSMTKPITSVGIMMLQEEGRLLLSDPVSKYLPQLAKLEVAMDRFDPATGKRTSYTVPAERAITIQDLLRHTSGFAYGSRTPNAQVRDAYAKVGVDARDLSNAELIDRLAKVPLSSQPGTVWEYSRSTDVLGRVIEAISGVSLGTFFEQRILTPLKMTDTGFWVPTDKHGRVAQAFAVDPSTKEAIKLIDVTAQPKYESGGGGAVSTAADYVRFSQMLLNGGTLDGVRLLSRTTVQYMASDQLGRVRQTYTTPGYSFGLGFSVRMEPGLGPQSSSVGEYNWGGAGGTFFWVDPREEVVAILMTQAPGPIRLYYRQLFRQMVQQAIVD